jgi:alpha-galactosidase
MTRIAFVGAGSVEFTAKLLGDILAFRELASAEIALHDIDPERHDAAEAIAQRVSRGLGASAAIGAHLDRREALDGADYVICTVQVGMHEATLRDFEIPLKYGLRQTIGDTIGIGGIFRALRTIPVLQSIAADMAELCPEAWLLNYTNPMAMLCWSVYAGTPLDKVVGLCHSVQGTIRTLADYIGVPVEEVTFLAAGVNHQAFVLRFERDGENLYPLLDEAIERNPELERTVRIELYRRLGYFQTESSEHAAEYVPWFLGRDEREKHFRIPIGEYVRRSAANVRAYEKTRRMLASGVTFRFEPSGEYASLLIHSIEAGIERVVYGNVENTGLITNLPAGCCVEVPCLVDGAGVQPTHVGSLPPQLAALNRTYVNVCELTVQAALEGTREHVYHAAMLDPNTAATLTLDEIWSLVDELIDAHGDALPDGIRANRARV